MSQRPIARSPDLKRLRDEGLDLRVINGYLTVRQVPYVTSKREVARGTIIISLGDTADDVAKMPRDHTILFDGEYPCHANGRRIERMNAGGPNTEIGEGVVGRHYFSAKPKPLDHYDGFYHQVTSYIAILGGPAAAIDPKATAAVFPLVSGDDVGAEEVFEYVDTASSRADIVALSQKLALPRVGIVGLGGTGGYVLDLVAKTPVREIHTFDGDRMYQHNAFRAPGAASRAQLAEAPYKVDYYHGIYRNMRRGIVPHAYFITPETVDELAGMDFVFLCMEGEGKRAVVARLEELGVSFIDVGMGVYMTANGSLGGVVRATLSTPAMRQHVHEHDRIGFNAANDRNEYDRNIQIADLNMANAFMAVMRWKKLFGFYADLQHEHHTTLQIVTNELSNEDAA
jgi:hypothetical protein